MTAGEPTSGRLRFGGSRTWLPVTIAVISILSSVVSWRAAMTGGRSAELQASAQRLELQRVQREGEIRGWIEHDRNVVVHYAENVAQSYRYLRESKVAVDKSAASAASYRAESLNAQARVLEPFFLTGLPDGATEYFVKFWRNDATLETAALARDAAEKRAEDARRKTTWLVGVVAVLVLSLFFFTVARLAAAPLRVALASVGIAVSVTGMSVFIAVESLL